jgi:thioredoxin reductase (NADPH)
MSASADSARLGKAMSQSAESVLAARRDQTFPVLTQADIDRLRHLGEERSFQAGEHILKAGEVAPGLIVILSGLVEVTQGYGPDQRETIVTHHAGQFVGELAQLSARPALVDAEALEPVKALVIRSDRLRDLFMQEAELGERIMRALILRRVGLLESGVSGPIIVGRANNADVLRLDVFLARNGQPHRVLDPESDSCARTLIERFAVDEHHLPIVLCPNGKLLLNPGEHELARCIGLAARSTRRKPMTWRSSALGRPDWRPPYMPPPRAWKSSFLIAAPLADRRALLLVSKTT